MIKCTKGCNLYFTSNFLDEHVKTCDLVNKPIYDNINNNKYSIYSVHRESINISTYYDEYLFNPSNTLFCMPIRKCTTYRKIYKDCRLSIDSKDTNKSILFNMDDADLITSVIIDISNIDKRLHKSLILNIQYFDRKVIDISLYDLAVIYNNNRINVVDLLFINKKYFCLLKSELKITIGYYIDIDNIDIDNIDIDIDIDAIFLSLEERQRILGVEYMQYIYGYYKYTTNSDSKKTISVLKPISSLYITNMETNSLTHPTFPTFLVNNNYEYKFRKFKTIYGHDCYKYISVLNENRDINMNDSGDAFSEFTEGDLYGSILECRLSVSSDCIIRYNTALVIDNPINSLDYYLCSDEIKVLSLFNMKQLYYSKYLEYSKGIKNNKYLDNYPDLFRKLNRKYNIHKNIHDGITYTDDISIISYSNDLYPSIMYYYEIPLYMDKKDKNMNNNIYYDLLSNFKQKLSNYESIIDITYSTKDIWFSKETSNKMYRYYINGKYYTMSSLLYREFMNNDLIPPHNLYELFK